MCVLQLWRAKAVDLVRRSWLNARGKKEMASRWWRCGRENDGGRRWLRRDGGAVAGEIGREKKMALLFVVRRREDGVCCRIMVVADEDGGCRGFWCVAGEVGGGGCGGWKERRKLGLGFWEIKMMTWQNLIG
ncbi:hypothetical protein DEO72_LG7g1269 [Vigna unguiculata]|uniref:Uncharacterized protein n=1 Tax=Vigna unguiculata TaxID=3917 RepID=A0A4D6MEW1_VIGUN|nr:hypothetical protein DEO72_LG7g1269 [Vigna unguiculata]